MLLNITEVMVYSMYYTQWNQYRCVYIDAYLLSCIYRSSPSLLDPDIPWSLSKKLHEIVWIYMSLFNFDYNLIYLIFLNLYILSQYSFYFRILLYKNDIVLASSCISILVFT